MKKMTILPLVLAAAGMIWSTAGAEAQIERGKATPAEFPPASFSGKQYVDSRGCVYVRAGVDGATTWVPRVARNRQVICGFQPTVTAGASSGPAARAGSGQVVQITPRGVADAPAARPAPAPRVAAPAPRRQPVANRASARAPTRTVASIPARQPVVRPVTPAPVVVAPRPAPDGAVAPKRSVAANKPAAACEGYSAISSRYINPPPGVRCGPQSAPIVTLKGETQRVRTASGKVRTVRTKPVAVYAGTSGATRVTGQTVIAPRATYAERRNAQTRVPEGYKMAWEDGRLNPKRAHQTLDGRRKMLLTWSSTVPRQLIDSYTGEEVSRYFPDLKYPYTSPRQQAAAEQVAKTKTPQVQVITPKATVSSKSAPQKTRAQAATHRFVQVGAFRNPANVRAAVARLTRAGLPVKLGVSTSGKSQTQLVLVGPFARQDALTSALNRARKAGFGDAFLRK